MNYAQIYSDWVKGLALESLKPEQRRALPLIVSGAASAAELEAAGAGFVFGIKQAAAFSARSTVSGPIEKAKAGEYVIPWVLSDASPDRMGDVISADGWRLDNFRKNPVILWGHGGGGVLDGDEPIGRGERVRVEKGKLVADLVFAVDESDRAARKFRLANSGYIKAGSVGFKPIKVERVEDEEERTKLGLGRFGVLYKEQELLEFSLVAVPANPHALQQSVKAGEIQAEDAEWLAREAGTLTERDMERVARKKASGLVVVTPAPVAPVPSDDGIRKLVDLLRAKDAAPIGELVECMNLMRASFEETTRKDMESRIAEAESRHALAQALAMHSKAITDLSGHLGALRTAEPVSSADAGSASKARDDAAIVHALEEILRSR